jgi:hypothetical protein
MVYCQYRKSSTRLTNKLEIWVILIEETEEIATAEVEGADLGRTIGSQLPCTRLFVVNATKIARFLFVQQETSQFIARSVSAIKVEMNDVLETIDLPEKILVIEDTTDQVLVATEGEWVEVKQRSF